MLNTNRPHLRVSELHSLRWFGVIKVHMSCSVCWVRPAVDEWVSREVLTVKSHISFMADCKCRFGTVVFVSGSKPLFWKPFVLWPFNGQHCAHYSRIISQLIEIKLTNWLVTGLLRFRRSLLITGLGVQAPLPLVQRLLPGHQAGAFLFAGSINVEGIRPGPTSNQICRSQNHHY